MQQDKEDYLGVELMLPTFENCGELAAIKET